MTRPLGFLKTATTTTATATTSRGPPPPPPTEQVNSDFVVILAALLCALICVLGLAAVVRCAWLRRLTNSGTISNHQQQQQHQRPPAAANKGLKKKVLRSLPTQPYSPELKDSDCAICLAEFGEGDELRVLPQCGHGFHVVCIDTWLGAHSSCPSCRQILVVGRCKNCGGVPSASATPPVTTETSAAAGSSEVRRKEREDGDVANRYLP